jgi:hypothetical protein
MFTPTPDALVEVSALLRVINPDKGDGKILFAKVGEHEQTFRLTVADCRHLAIMLLRGLPDPDDEKPAAALQHKRNK